MTRPIAPRPYYTKSRSGHWSLTVRNTLGHREKLFSIGKLSDLGRAREAYGAWLREFELAHGSADYSLFIS